MSPHRREHYETRDTIIITKGSPSLHKRERHYTGKNIFIQGGRSLHRRERHYTGEYIIITWQCIIITLGHVIIVQGSTSLLYRGVCHYYMEVMLLLHRGTCHLHRKACHYYTGSYVTNALGNTPLLHMVAHYYYTRENVITQRTVS